MKTLSDNSTPYEIEAAVNNINFSPTWVRLSPKTIDKLNNDYQKQVINFLIKSNSKIDIKYLGQSFTPWNNSALVNKYLVTLKTSKHIYNYDFYDSIKNTNDNKKATYDYYSVLAALCHTVPKNFDDFCSDYGYEFSTEREYVKIKNIHIDCLDQCNNLRKLYDEDQLTQLNEII